MFKRVDKESLGCPVVFNEEMIALVRIKNVSNGHQKSQKFSTFQFFNVFFSKFSTDRQDWNFEKSQQRKKCVVQYA